MTASTVISSDLSDRILAALERVPAGLTPEQLVLALGYAETDRLAVTLALHRLRGAWKVESYLRSTPAEVVTVWQHRRFGEAHRILFLQREVA